MAERLGDYLVHAGRITERQLSLVLERQVTMGGRLGTNLIELGFLSENELTQFLSQKLRIPSIQASDLEEIGPAVIQLVPREVAQKYHVVPIRRERSVLSVALLDPTDLEVIDELRFITGCDIKPYVASEARIQYALEQHYQIDRKLRYVSILDDERRRHEGQGDPETEKTARKQPTPEELETALRQAKEDWVEARDRDEAIATFLKAANVALDRGVFLLVKAGTVTGWKAFPAYREAQIAGIDFKLEEPSLFKDVVKAKTFYQGPTPLPANNPVYQGVFDALGGRPPDEVLLLPILINDQVVAILYGDNAVSGRLIRSLEFLRKLAHKTAMALEILILKRKIREL